MDVEGKAIPRMRSRKALWVLALLALRHGREVERQWLAATLWPEVDISQGLSNLRPTLTELRRALGSQGHRLRINGRLTLWLDVDGAEVDLIQFDQHVAKGEKSDLERAAKLYRGPLLEGCTEEWVFQDRYARQQECARILQQLADEAFNEGDFAAAIAFCRRIIFIDPLRDEPRRRLMESLEASGDRNAALQTFREFADLLRKELGAPPDDKTSELYLRMRRAARRQNPLQYGVVEPQAGPTVPSGNLPSPISSLVGREDECLEVLSKLRRSRLVTLTGPGGIGKTRLAIELGKAASQETALFPDGTWFVALESISDASQIPSRIMTILDLREEIGGSSTSTLTGHLRGRRLLLVLDNCEHLLSACSQLVERLLSECPGAKVLATSREPLGIVGEIAWALPSLSTPNPEHLPGKRSTLVRVLAGYESIQLFTERAQAAQKTFELTNDNAPFVAQICFHLEGLPLAIELAAARVRTMTVAEIASRLDERLALLTNTGSAASTRQQTLRASLAWSYNLLTDVEQCLLRRLSVFIGGWTLEAAEEICSGEGLQPRQTLDILGSLIDKSLLAVSDSGTEAGGVRTRYHLLDSVRQYSADRAFESGEEAQLRSRHLAYFLKLVEEAEPQLKGPHQQLWLSRLEVERANLGAALDSAFAQPETRLRLAASLGRFWELRGYYGEARTYLRSLLLDTESLPPTRWRAKVLRIAGEIAYYQGDLAEARQRHGEALEASRELGDKAGTAWALNHLADVLSAQGDEASAKVLYEQSLTIFRELDDPVGIADLVHHLGRLFRDQGDYDQAARLYAENLELQRELGNETGFGWTLHHLGNLAYLKGDLFSARALQSESLELFRRLKLKQGVAWALIELGLVSELEGSPYEAEAHYAESLGIFRELGNVQGVGAAIQRSGKLSLDRGEFRVAREMFEQSLSIRHSMGNRIGVAECLSAIAEVDAAEGHARKAVRLWGAADSLRKSVLFSPSQHERERIERLMEQPRLDLGVDKFSAVWLGAMAMTMDQAVAEAMSALVAL